MEQVTVLCCYNNKSEFEKLKKSLSDQSVKVALIGIDNTEDTYSSCAAAFNEYLNKVHTEYVVFSHQDIVLPDKELMKQFIEVIKDNNMYDIVGVAGRNEEGHVLTNIYHGNELKYAGEKRVSKTELCDTIDECFFGGYTKGFVEYPFDEKLCNNWHLYAVDRCLDARTRGNKVFVCGIPILHKSMGKINDVYNWQFYKLSKKYKNNFNFINTTCAFASTIFPKREIAFIKRAISIKLGRY